MTVRVLIADDHPVVRAGVTALLDTDPDLRLLRPQPPLPRLLPVSYTHLRAHET